MAAFCRKPLRRPAGMVAVRKHLEGEARSLGDDAINARLESYAGFARDGF